MSYHITVLIFCVEDYDRCVYIEQMSNMFEQAILFPSHILDA